MRNPAERETLLSQVSTAGEGGRGGGAKAKDSREAAQRNNEMVFWEMVVTVCQPKMICIYLTHFLALSQIPNQTMQNSRSSF